MTEQRDTGSEQELERKILGFGKEIFEAIGREQPSAFNKNYWSGRIMEWSMAKPDFKTNMFRLVDVLPALESSRAIAQHVNEYLSEVAGDVHGLVEWGVNVKPDSLRAKVTSLFVKRGVRQMAQQFIAGETPDETLKALRRLRKDGLAFTVDLLGEFSVSEREALEYLARYEECLSVFGETVPKWPESAPIIERHPGETSPVCVSVKLTALYSQTSVLNFDRSVAVLSERLGRIAERARATNALLYVDAEDTANNPIIYETFKRVFGSPEFRDFPYPGIVLQAYCRDASRILEDLFGFAERRGAPIAIRLVKGAYWDHETILSQQHNWPSPVFSHKQSSDANFERLSRMLIDRRELCLPAFGSHNVRSLSHACCYAASKGVDPREFELQMLYGMAEPIARAFARKGYLIRLYVPQGEMIPGMGYLVRRLLENTSNESFLRHTFVEAGQAERLLAKPVMAEADLPRAESESPLGEAS